MKPPLYLLGEQGRGGTYVLRIHLSVDKPVIFGRFQKGKSFTLPQGEYAYTGSALNPNGATSLAPRLLRHATRSGGRPPHAIRAVLWQQFLDQNFGSHTLRPPTTKKLHWNVDYLLDLPEAELREVYALRSPQRLEGEIGAWLAASRNTEIIAPGLGANDLPGGTHLVRVIGGNSWWEELLAWLKSLLGAND